MSETAEQPTTEAPVPKWGDPISAERQAELQEYLDRWQAKADHGERKGSFDGVKLTGADVSWLAEQSGRGKYRGEVPNLHLETLYVNTLDDYREVTPRCCLMGWY